MSVSQHPIALRIESVVGGQTTLLATVMFLPLIDGVFAALVLAGTLDSIAGILMVGLLVFGGSATVAVVVADLEGSPTECAQAVLLVGIPLIVLSAGVAALAPTIASILDLIIFERFAALVIIGVAAQTASARVGQYLPRPAVIVGLGLLASATPASAQLTVMVDPMLITRGAAAAGVGVGFATFLALIGPQVRRNVDLDRFRFGSAVALGVLPLSILGLPFGEYAPLGVLAMTTLFALDPERPDEDEEPDLEQELDEDAAIDSPSEETERAPWL